MMQTPAAGSSSARPNMMSSAGTCGGELRKGGHNDDGTPVKDESAIFDEYRPGLKNYLSAQGAGSFKMRVSSHGVVVDFYGGDSRQITESFVLR